MNWKPVILGVVTVLLIVVVTAILKRSQSGRTLGPVGIKLVEAVAGDPPRAQLPEFVPGYMSQLGEPSEAELSILPKDTTFGRRTYRAEDGFEMAVNIVLMGTDRTSIHKPEFCLVGQGLSIDRRDQEVVRVNMPHAYDLPVWKYVCSRDVTAKTGQTVKVGALYVFWFVSDGAITTSHWEMAWLSAKDLILKGRLCRWAYVSCFALFPPEAESAAWERMRSFLSRAVPEFQVTAGSRIAARTPAAPGLTLQADAR